MKRLQQIFILLATTLTLSAQAPVGSVRLRNISVINTTTLDFSPTFYKNGIVFVSCNTVEGKNKAYDEHISRSAMSVFVSQKDINGHLQKPEPFSLDLQSTLHEGPLCFDKSYETVFFCRNDSKKSDDKNAEKVHYVNGYAYMKIYAAQKMAGIWSSAEELPINAEKSDACHPSLSADGTRLYFASNRPGGYGGMDIYMSEKVYGIWSKPVNLGSKINTPKNEAFPFIHESGVLFFSSEDKEEKTGWDIYRTRINANGVYEMPEKMGAPINSEKDDFGFILDADYQSGYLTSNRNGGVGEDDIYAFTALNGFSFLPIPRSNEEQVSAGGHVKTPKKTITIFAIDRKTGYPIQSVVVSTIELDENGSAKPIIYSFVTDKNGKTALSLMPESHYILKAHNSNFIASDFSVLSDDSRDEIIVLLDEIKNDTLEKIMKVSKMNVKE